MATLVGPDPFTAADTTDLTTYNANWVQTTAGAFVINTNSVSAAPTANHEARWSAVTFPNDQWAQGTIVSLGTARIGPAVRVDTGGARTCYAFRRTPTPARQLVKDVAGALTQLGAVAADFTVSDVAYVEAVGTAVTAKRNGAIDVGPITDAAIVAGAAGLHADGVSTATQLDDWSAGNFITGGPHNPQNLVRRASWRRRKWHSHR